MKMLTQDDYARAKSALQYLIDIEEFGLEDTENDSLSVQANRAEKALESLEKKQSVPGTTIRYAKTGVPFARLDVDRPLAVSIAKEMVRYGRSDVIITYPDGEEQTIEVSDIIEQ